MTDENLQVIVIEDDRDIAEMTSVILRREGWQVQTLNRPFEVRSALEPELWRTAKVAVVDLMMDEIDGIAILEYLAENQPHVYRVVMTAAVWRIFEKADRVAHLADRVLAKPFNVGELIEIVESICGRP